MGIPVIVGSCGTGGGVAGLAWMRDICFEIAREEGLAFSLALVHSEQDKAYLKRRLREGYIRRWTRPRCWTRTSSTAAPKSSG